MPEVQMKGDVKASFSECMLYAEKYGCFYLAHRMVERSLENGSAEHSRKIGVRKMNIPRKVFVLGSPKIPDAMERTCAEVERIGLTPIRHWNFPTPYTKFVQKHIVNANKAMKHSGSVLQQRMGALFDSVHSKDLGDVACFCCRRTIADSSRTDIPFVRTGMRARRCRPTSP